MKGNNLMSKDEINRVICRLLNKKLGVKIDNSLYNAHLFSSEISLQPRQLVYLYFLIEEEFSISINTKYIINNCFSSLNNIVEIIYCTLNNTAFSNV